MTAQVFKAIGGGLLSVWLVVIVEFLSCLRAHGVPGMSGQRLETETKVLMNDAAISWHFRARPDSVCVRD